MMADYALVLLALLAAVAYSGQAENDEQYRKDLKQINYYNWLLHRHRTEKQKIEKVNDDIKNKRLVKLQEILHTPNPHNVSLIATDDVFARLSRFVHPIGSKPVTESVEELTHLLSTQRRQGTNVQSDATVKKQGLVEFQISEREYEKFSKFFNNSTMRKNVKKT